MNKFYQFWLLSILVLFSTSLIGQSNTASFKKEKLKPYLDVQAMIHMDFIYDLKQMDPDWIGGLRPSKIPIYKTDPGWGTFGHTYFSVRQSTFKFDGGLPTHHKWGDMILHFSFDLFGMGVHAGETTIRLRLAYGEWGPFMIGRNWSTFCDLEAFPNNYDWWGPSGMILLPSNHIRYTQKIGEKNTIELAIEIPGSEIDAGQLRQIDPNLLNLKTKELLPDFVGRYTFRTKGGYIKAAILLRQLTFEKISLNLNQVTQDSRFGWAANLTSSIYTFHKKGAFRLQTVIGQGYAGYNNDGGVEITPDENFGATVPLQFGFSAFYDHNFTKKWMTSIGFSETHQNNSAGQTEDAFNKSYYSVAQLIYQIIDNHLTIGLSLQYGQRFNNDGNTADDERIMFSARYQISRVH